MLVGQASGYEYQLFTVWGTLFLKDLDNACCLGYGQIPRNHILDLISFQRESGNLGWQIFVLILKLSRKIIQIKS